MPRNANSSLYVELSDYAFLVALVNASKEAMEIEALLEVPLDTPPEQVTEMMLQLTGTKKGQLCQAVCGVYPEHCLIRRSTLENPSKAKDPAYLPEYVRQQFNIEVTTHMIMVMNAVHGTEFRAEKATTKELIFAGAPKSRLQALQDHLLSCNIYPDRLELGTLSTIGGLTAYCRETEVKSPTLMLEITENQAQVFIFHGEQLDVARPIPYGLSSMYPLVQKELGLKDEVSARRLFSSNTFDFTEMGPVLMKKMLKELQASTGFYEVQTGQTIGQIYLNLLPENLDWIGSSLSRTLGVEVLQVDVQHWLQLMGISVTEGVDMNLLTRRGFGLFSLMGNYNTQPELAHA